VVEEEGRRRILGEDEDLFTKAVGGEGGFKNTMEALHERLRAK
jgi:hypothetical protein